MIHSIVIVPVEDPFAFAGEFFEDALRVRGEVGQLTDGAHQSQAHEHFKFIARR